MNISIKLFKGSEQIQTVKTPSAPIVDLISESLVKLKETDCDLAHISDTMGNLVCYVHQNGNVGKMDPVTNQITWKKVKVTAKVSD